jgi:DNA-binding transcriptional MerR regulator
VEKLVKTQEAAELVGLAPQTLRMYRCRGEGPAFIKLAPNRVCYRVADLESFVESRRRLSTADPGPAGPSRAA